MGFYGFKKGMSPRFPVKSFFIPEVVIYCGNVCSGSSGDFGDRCIPIPFLRENLAGYGQQIIAGFRRTLSGDFHLCLPTIILYSNNNLKYKF
jgi:hypothetical protein